MNIFEYSEVEMDYLKSVDEKLGKAIDVIGKIERETGVEIFSDLIRSVVGQQISVKAQATVWGRLVDLVGDMTASNIASKSEEEIKSCGLSYKKAGYILGIANAVLSGELVIEELYNLPDKEVIKKLSSLNGVGVWTAEMILIFSMKRPDVLSYGDLAIIRGMKILYGLEELKKPQFETYRKIYSPYGTVASLYLWEISTGSITL